jgi:hypothetical protein
VNYFVLGSLFIFSFSNSAIAEEKQVTAIGTVAIGNDAKDVYQKKALDLAFRNAVERELGVYIQAHTEIKNGEMVKDEILQKATGYVHEHEIVKEETKAGQYSVTIDAKISVDRIGEDFKKIVGKVKKAMGNPSITFVLTTWESKGKRTSYNQTDKVSATGTRDEKASVQGEYAAQNSSQADAKLAVKSTAKVSDTQASSDGAYAGSARVEATGSASAKRSSSESGSVNGKYESSQKVDASLSVTKSGVSEKIDESLWKKYPDATIIDSFQQEFKDKGFDLKASDKAREIALTESLVATSVNPNDRTAVRKEAEKEGANFVARGEARIIDTRVSEETGNFEITAQVGVEIIDVNSGEVVSSYSNTSTASSKSEPNAKVQAIKKVAILGAKTLAEQTIDTWKERAESGRQYTIEVQNITSMRKQKKPILDALEAADAEITNQTSPSEGVLLVTVKFKGAKNKLSDGVMDKIGDKPGFSEKEFDGPFDEGGKIVFKFTK